ncbi:unnamed protein product [Allacma fusca]|uniref:Uncharacterized protein n=1 Tax=Allacma fusca TaxID=39272 RepID=A0A8J2PDV4_9HEXA|nr:unnamed protein product [Allacma fusca]
MRKFVKWVIGDQTVGEKIGKEFKAAGRLAKKLKISFTSEITDSTALSHVFSTRSQFPLAQRGPAKVTDRECKGNWRITLVEKLKTAQYSSCTVFWDLAHALLSVSELPLK